jgi:hypothetical protein
MKIAQYRVEEFLKKIATFNRKAVKLALPEVKAVKIGSELLEQKWKNPADGSVETFYIEIQEFDIQGEIPRIGGWAIHSKVEPDNEGRGNFVYTRKGFDPVEKLRTTKMVCEHCNMIRARSLVYLLQNMETGEQKLVGKSCLKDFLPNLNVTEVLGYLESLDKLAAPFEQRCDDDGDPIDGGNLPRAAWLYPVDMLVAESLVLIRRDGYVSKKMAADHFEEITATASLLANTGRSREKLYSQAEIAEQFDQGRVEACIEWIKAQDAKSDFFYNLQLAIGQTGAPWKMFSFVAAGVSLWQRAIEADVAKKLEKQDKKNEWVGEVGQRLVFTDLTITREYVTQGQFGSTFITTMEDAEGHTFTWFASKPVGEVGTKVSIKATIKEHKLFNDLHQTVLTRGAKI